MSTPTRTRLVATAAVIFIFVGFFIRDSATELAWPRTYSFSGPRSETQWGRKEVAYQHAGLVLMLFGFMLTTAVVNQWMRPS